MTEPTEKLEPTDNQPDAQSAQAEEKRRTALKHRLWRRERLRRKGFIGSVRTLLHFALDRARENDLTEVTSTMALATLTAIVPVLALSLAAFSAFPGFADARWQFLPMVLRKILSAGVHFTCTWFPVIVNSRISGASPCPSGTQQL